ncbi:MULTISPECIES: GTA head formation protein, RCAP_rcc01685 family [Phaeobacter]|uniref:Gene transfer agent protein n=2 Tax=Phaeobacter TaxID=302485 RepID=A0AAN1LAL6_9RHOB|nr:MULTISPECIES: hypothetical protein [Phaeobacter]ATG43605.1 hypothetical protein PhaeoP13_01668 [Phaeobacter piscinae]AUQ49740.1 hypothetical protein PhaeoP83_01462 [Phaeobacter inhibens]AUQ58723.1 hypothetical protein PhaeoP30_01808 [Phaeobacter inhibens]AUQ66348.1 hypothetical protein PhaeoP78_01481 [Phaeobacter inhibens]AUQ70666.1 hypothetical protein PhaeoP54_01778 [Phaeobacter inhibens]
MTEIPIPPFECSPGLRLTAHERIAEIQQEAMNRRLDRLEMMMERMEKRLWLTVYGVAAVILAQAFQSFLAVQ